MVREFDWVEHSTTGIQTTKKGEGLEKKIRRIFRESMGKLQKATIHNHRKDKIPDRTKQIIIVL